MPPDLLARLLATMRGETTFKTGVTGVAGVAAVARYASKTPEIRQLRPLRVKNTKLEKDVFEGVAGGVASPSEAVDAPCGPLYDPARLQREANRRNAEAARYHSTDRFCRCGHFGTFAWFGDDGREVWRCAECAPTRGRA
jgi:hypothetical protein